MTAFGLKSTPSRLLRGGSDRYHADVRLLRLFSRDKPRHEVVSCYKLTPDLAEHAALIWAKRWVDANGDSGKHGA